MSQGKNTRSLSFVRYHFTDAPIGFDNQSEVLTRRGWLNPDNVDIETDEIATVSSLDGSCQWVRSIRKIQTAYSGLIHHYEGRSYDIFITPESELLYSPQTLRSGFGRICSTDIDLPENNYDPETKQSLGSRNFRVHANCFTSGNDEYSLILDGEIRMVAWLLTDGHICASNTGITQRVQKAHLITDILDQLKWQYRVHVRQREARPICGVELKKPPCPTATIVIKGESRDRLLELCPSKKTRLPQWIWSLSDRQFRIFLDSLIDGDGSRHKANPLSSWMLYGKKEFLDQIQELCVVYGIRTTISVYNKKNHRLNISPLQQGQHVCKKACIPFSGLVYSFVLPNGNLVVRRNGKPSLLVGHGRRVHSQHLDKTRVLSVA